jgi:hypothetical protein
VGKEDGTAKCCLDALAKGEVFLDVVMGRIVREHVKPDLIGLQIFWLKPSKGINDRCEFWTPGVAHCKEGARRTTHLRWTIFYRPMVDGEVGEVGDPADLKARNRVRRPQDDVEDMLLGDGDDGPPFGVPVSSKDQPSAADPESSRGAAAKGKDQADASLEVPAVVVEGDTMFLVNPDVNHQEIKAEVTVTHVCSVPCSYVPSTLLGAKVLVPEGYVGVTIRVLKSGEMSESQCKKFLAKFAKRGPAFDPLVNDYPGKLTTKAKLV